MNWTAVLITYLALGVFWLLFTQLLDVAEVLGWLIGAAIVVVTFPVYFVAWFANLWSKK